LGIIAERVHDTTASPCWFRPRVTIEMIPMPGREELSRLPLQMLSA
jgi:hypothetical protein